MCATPRLCSPSCAFTSCHRRCAVWHAPHVRAVCGLLAMPRRFAFPGLFASQRRTPCESHQAFELAWYACASCGVCATAMRASHRASQSARKAPSGLAPRVASAHAHQTRHTTAAHRYLGRVPARGAHASARGHAAEPIRGQLSSPCASWPPRSRPCKHIDAQTLHRRECGVFACRPALEL